ncbi:hypothetical protein ACQKMV_05180 [Lysinibacillus sp. NPDC094403]|uniref:hypothetical protein n=1 Tax=Lysinibacillus sp. NPDC094403 TaxID=3390581 RepID=UPI003D07C8C1
MDWLDEAAKKHSEFVKAQKSEAYIERVIKESYPKKVAELWDMFKSFYDLAKDKFDGSKVFSAKGNEMQIVIGDIEIRGYAEEVEKMGGYYGTVNVNIKYLNSNRIGNAHFDNLLLGHVNETPTWVYRDIVNEIMTDVIFTQEDVEKIFKSAFSIYR